MRIKLDAAAPRLGKTDWNKLAERTEEELHQAALDDPDNPPLTDEELARFAPAPDVRKIREQLELTQSEFALRYHLSLATVRDWEQGRYRPDQSARTLLRLIARQPKLVADALK